MVQVDIFWTFAVGASFAAAANKQLKKEDSFYENKFFRYNLLFLSVLFVPSGLYLLWLNTGWETMFMLNRNMPAIIPCLFAMTNILFGILGFYLAYKFIKKGQKGLADLLWIFGYAVMFSILGIGWRRFTYAGTFEEYNGMAIANKTWFHYECGGLPLKKYAVTDFFSCDIFYALLGMGVIILPAMIFPLIKWVKEGEGD